MIGNVLEIFSNNDGCYEDSGYILTLDKDGLYRVYYYAHCSCYGPEEGCSDTPDWTGSAADLLLVCSQDFYDFETGMILPEPPKNKSLAYSELRSYVKALKHIQPNQDRQTLTYRELAQLISEMTDDQKDSHITLFNSDQEEFYPAKLDFTEECDILDENHPYFVAK